jgi:hypothetical protein
MRKKIFIGTVLLMMISCLRASYAETGEVDALRNEIKALKSDLADLKGQMRLIGSRNASPVPAYVAPVEGAKDRGVLGIAKDIDMGGYVDVQWNQNFNDGFKKNNLNDLRFYDNNKDTFAVNQALLWFEKAVKDSGQAGFRLELMMGQDAVTQGADGSNGDAFDLAQAYAEYKAGLGFWSDNDYLPHDLDIKAGRMATLAGAEVPYAPQNNEISRGLLAGYAVPTFHTGLRANFKVWKNFFDVYFGINNGWDQAIDMNTNKTLEWGLGYEPVKNLKFLHSIYLGQETLGAGSNDLSGNRFLNSNVVTWTPTDKLSLAGEFDVGTTRGIIKYDGQDSTDSNWFGMGAHAKYQLTKQFAPYYRVEWMGNQGKTQFGGLTDDVLENTFGAEYKLTQDLITRAEYRMDKSVGNKAYDGKFSQEQTLEGQVIYLIG